MTSKKFNRYLLVALAGLAADYSALIVAKEISNIHYLTAAIIGFMVGLAVNYMLSSRYVFSNPKFKSPLVNFLLFGGIGLTGLAILNILMWSQVALLEVHYLIAKTVATAIVYFWNYFARAALYRN